MTPSPLFAAYLAAARPVEQGALHDDVSPRPKGAVVWAICAGQDQLTAMKTVSRHLDDDGEVVTVIATVPTGSNDVTITPNTRRTTRAFLDHWQPELILWVDGPLDPPVLFEISKSSVPAILIASDDASVTATTGRRVPGLVRQCLRVFGDVLTIDDTVTTRLIKAGSDPSISRAIGILDDAVTPPPCDDTERAALAIRLSTRPLWLAADIPLTEAAFVAAACRHAARRAHRTLMIVTPRAGEDTAAIADVFRNDGLSVACRHHGEKPRDATQVYLVDTDEGLGLWCRLSSTTYLGGSLSDGQAPDPFIPALVGSAVVAGPSITSHRTHLNRLADAGAIRQVSTPDGLGRAIEDLLATDIAAHQAHAAWDVTSRGADATNELMSVIYTYLDQVDS